MDTPSAGWRRYVFASITVNKVVGGAGGAARDTVLTWFVAGCQSAVVPHLGVRRGVTFVNGASQFMFSRLTVLV